MFSENESNTVSYNNRLRDKTWREQHLGQYVVFVDGKYLATGTDRESLIRSMEIAYPDKLVLIASVGKEEELIDIPTPFIE